MVAVHGVLSYRQCGHLTSDDYALMPEEACEMHVKACQQAKLTDSESI